MKIEVKGNKNYCATIAKVEKIIPIEGADRIQKAIVLNTCLVVSKDVEVGTIGIFFPVETALSHDFLKYNNLYKEGNLNSNIDKKGSFETNRRIKCVKFRGSASEGLFMPLSSLSYLNVEDLNVGDEFDHINGVKICEKYIARISGSGKTQKGKSGKQPKKAKKQSKLIDGIFRLHYDTQQLKKNIHRINYDTLISISDKWHGTSLVVSNVLTKKKLSVIDKIGKFFKVNVKETEYSKIYSSRRVIKNQFIKTDKNPGPGFYEENVWETASNLIFPFLQKGMSAYCEIVGYLKNGKEIQKGYTYGCEPYTFKVVVYRITYTNEDGNVIEMPFMQMKEFCNKYGIQTVPFIFYGYAQDYLGRKFYDKEAFAVAFLAKLEEDVQHKNCEYNPGKPKEGVVIKIDGINESTAFKYKNIDFLEYETKLLDKGEGDIESDQENEEN